MLEKNKKMIWILVIVEFIFSEFRLFWRFYFKSFLQDLIEYRNFLNYRNG